MAARAALSRLLFGALLLAPLARAEDVPPETMAQIKADEQVALDKINAAHGNKKPSEMSSSERREVISEQQKATAAAAEKSGVSAKDYARTEASMNGSERDQMNAAAKSLEAKQKAQAATDAAAAKAKKDDPSAAVPVEYGIPDEDQPPPAAKAKGSQSYDSFKVKKGKGR